MDQLDKYKKAGGSTESGFKVPPGYFDNLTDRVMANVAVESRPRQQRSIVRSIRSAILSPRYAAAAAVVLVLIVALVMMPAPGSEQDLLAGISDEAAYTYVMENLHNYNAEDLLEVADGIDMSDSYTFEDDEIDKALDEILDEIDPSEFEILF